MAFLHVKDYGVQIVAGKFTGGTTPAASVGKAFSVSYSPTGLYTVTILGPKPVATNILYAHATVVESGSIEATEATTLRWKPDGGTAGTVTFQAERGVVNLTDLTLIEAAPPTLDSATLTNTPTAVALPSDAFASFVIVYASGTLVA